MNTSIKKIGLYEVQATIRSGPRPLFRVRARDGRVLALKAIAGLGVSPDARERFQREAAVCALLDHPNLVRVYDSGESDGFLYMVMDLLEGADLAQVIQEKQPMDWAQKLSVMQHVAAGLEYAHHSNLIHRDIKPANIFLENSGNARILDFGMVRTESSQLTRAGMAVGTLLYMAPEQLRGQTVTAATDVFAAGVVFYELATGRHPFAAGERDITKIATAIVFQKQPLLSELASDAPAGLDIVLEKVLQKDVPRRLGSAADLKRALELCRMGIDLRPAPVAASSGGSAAPNPAEDADMMKTRVAKAPVTPVIPRPRPTAPPRPAEQQQNAPPPPVKTESIYCPACTRENPKGTPICAYCGRPLESGPSVIATPETASKRWLVVTATVLAVIAILLIVWMMTAK